MQYLTFLGVCRYRLVHSIVKEMVTPVSKASMTKKKMLGRKAVTNLDSVLKSKDITLLTKVYIVKALVFPLVMYGCENWTVKKAEN